MEKIALNDSALESSPSTKASKGTFIGTIIVLVGGALLFFLPYWVGALVGGIGLGFLLTEFFFHTSVEQQVDVIKYALTAQTFQSSVERDSVYVNMLQNKGDWLHILALQGFLNAESANRLYEYVLKLLQADVKEETQYLVLNFRSVTGVDTAGLRIGSSMLTLLNSQGIELVIVSIPDDLAEEMQQGVERLGGEPNWHVFENLDYGVEWCEDQIINEYKEAGLAQRTRPKTKTLTVGEGRKDRLSGLMDYLEDRGEESVEKEKTLVERLKPYLREKDVAADEYIIKKGDRLSGLFFIEGGSVRVEIEGPDGNPVRLRKLQAGSVVGEVSLYGKKETTANVIADEDCQTYFLAKAKIRRIEKEDIALANDLHKFLAELLGFRTASTTDTIRTLLD